MDFDNYYKGLVYINSDGVTHLENGSNYLKSGGYNGPKRRVRSDDSNYKIWFYLKSDGAYVNQEWNWLE